MTSLADEIGGRYGMNYKPLVDNVEVWYDPPWLLTMVVGLVVSPSFVLLGSFAKVLSLSHCSAWLSIIPNSLPPRVHTPFDGWARPSKSAGSWFTNTSPLNNNNNNIVWCKRFYNNVTKVTAIKQRETDACTHISEPTFWPHTRDLSCVWFESCCGLTRLTHELYRFSNLEVMGVWERPKPLDINGLAWRLALKQEIDHSSQVLGQAPRLIFRMKLSGPKLLTVFLLPRHWRQASESIC